MPGLSDESPPKRRRELDATGTGQLQNDDDEDDNPPSEETPTLSRLSLSRLAAANNKPPRHTLNPVSPLRRRTRSPIKVADDLRRLQKPVHVDAIGNPKDALCRLPEDVRNIYTSVRSVAHHHKGFIPGEVREEVEEMLGSDVQSYWFQPIDDGDGDGPTTMRCERREIARAELDNLVRINHSAIESSRLCRYEDGWNVEAHMPMFKHVLDPANSWNKFQRQQQDHHHQVACEYIASATITADCIPRLGRPGTTSLRLPLSTRTGGGSTLACSVSNSDAASSTGTDEGAAEVDADNDDNDDVFTTNDRYDHGSAGGGSSNSTGNMFLAGWHSSKGGSKKVDFALVLVPQPSSSLRTAIQQIINLTMSTPSINQSAYTPLRYNPIAIAVEAKTATASRDPVVQLGFWTAAWHRRMEALRPPLAALADRTATIRTMMMVSLPLISIVNHEWKVYFACDRGTRIVSSSIHTIQYCHQTSPSAPPYIIDI